MINELDLLWLPNFIPLWIYFIFGTKFSWNEGIDTCFNVACVLLGRTFDFLGGYWSLPSGYCSLLLVTWWLLLVTARYYPFPLLVWTSSFRFHFNRFKKTSIIFIDFFVFRGTFCEIFFIKSLFLFGRVCKSVS